MNCLPTIKTLDAHADEATWSRTWRRWSRSAAQAVAEDLIAYAYRDPASRGRGELILESYASFKAVLVLPAGAPGVAFSRPDQWDVSRIALKLSNQGKILSGAEIHPAARIGRRLCSTMATAR